LGVCLGQKVQSLYCRSAPGKNQRLCM